MKVFYQLSTPDDMQAELTLTGSVKDFKALLKVINDHPSPMHWPQGSLRNAIEKVVRDASAQFEQEIAKDATL